MKGVMKGRGGGGSNHCHAWPYSVRPPHPHRKKVTDNSYILTYGCIPGVRASYKNR